MDEGKTLGGYHLIKRLGIGGAGTVWLAKNHSGTYVALKTIHPAHAADPVFKARMRREASTVNAVQSDGVAHVLDVELDEEQPFIVSEFINGPTLFQELKSGPLNKDSAVAFGRQMMAIISQVHAAHIVHRDIKPGNIILSPRGPVLIDFGIAQSDDDEALTAHGFVSGTASYASPELLRGSRANEDSDWWAWAATMLQALTGRPPFGAGSTEAIMNRVLNGRADTEGLPPAVARLFDLALAGDVSERLKPESLIVQLEDSRNWSWSVNPGADQTQILTPQTGVLVQPSTYASPSPRAVSSLASVPRVEPQPGTDASGYPQTVAHLPSSYGTSGAYPVAGFIPGDTSDGYTSGRLGADPSIYAGQNSYLSPMSEGETFNQMAPPSTPLMVFAVASALAMTPIFFGGLGLIFAIAVVIVVAFIGEFSRTLRIRRLEALGKRPSDWWVVLVRTPLIALKTVLGVALGLLAGAAAAWGAGYVLWNMMPVELRDTVSVRPYLIPDALYYSDTWPAIRAVSSNFYITFGTYLLVLLMFVVMWILPGGRGFNEGIALPARTLFPVAWIRGLVAMIILLIIYGDWFMSVPLGRFFV